MKILIVGENSYIGESFKNKCHENDNDYQIDTLDVTDKNWNKVDFSTYEAVFHVAAIVHQKKSRSPLYYEVNSDLALNVAKKAKESGVKHFVFMSTMAVYGRNSGAIKIDTAKKPKNDYGKSKLEAEFRLMEIADKTFLVSIVRPPIVYGKGAKGNYPRISSLVKKLPIFPAKNNKISMIYIDHLSLFIKGLIDNKFSGFFHPQNTNFVSTSDMARLIAKYSGKKIKITRLLNFVSWFSFLPTLQKVFGNHYYNLDMYEDNELLLLKQSNIYTFEQTIAIIETPKI